MHAGEILLLMGAAATLVAAPLLLAFAAADRARPVTRVCGWLALLASVVLFGLLAGWPRGLFFALFALALPALVLTWWQRDRRVVPMRQHPLQAPPSPGTTERLRPWLRGTSRTLVALLLGFLAASLAVIPVSYLAGSLSGGVVLALALAVALWALAALWVFADRTLWRPVAGLALVALVCAVPLWLR